VFEVFFVGALAAFDQAALQALGFWKILIGNVIAIIAMLGYFSTRHRGWVPRLRERWEVMQPRRT
jgi:O-antigen/teichoic acid export membrane protein